MGLTFPSFPSFLKPDSDRHSQTFYAMLLPGDFQTFISSSELLMYHLPPREQVVVVVMEHHLGFGRQGGAAAACRLLPACLPWVCLLPCQDYLPAMPACHAILRLEHYTGTGGRLGSAI